MSNKIVKRDYLSDFEQLVLLSVLRLGQDAHGGAIRRDLEETARRPVTVASIYVALSRLEQRGLARSWMSDPKPVRGGKARKHYALEPDGIRALREAREVLERMWAGVGGALDAAET
jgi:PadR family transcriptional regulator PadR